MSRQCLNHPDSFCYVCGEYVFKHQKLPINDTLQQAYHQYFGVKVGDVLKKPWVPHFCCTSCSRSLRGWKSGTHKRMPFGIPMIWREPRDHINDCYFCLTKTKGFSMKTTLNTVS